MVRGSGIRILFNTYRGASEIIMMYSKGIIRTISGIEYILVGARYRDSKR